MSTSTLYMLVITGIMFAPPPPQVMVPSTPAMKVIVDDYFTRPDLGGKYPINMTIKGFKDQSDCMNGLKFFEHQGIMSPGGGDCVLQDEAKPVASKPFVESIKDMHPCEQGGTTPCIHKDRVDTFVIVPSEYNK